MHLPPLHNSNGKSETDAVPQVGVEDGENATPEYNQQE